MTRTLSFAFGLMMVAAGALQGDGAALVAATVAATAVALGLLTKGAATVAVAATVAALVLSEPSPELAAVAGMAAAAYLVLTHAPGGRASMTVPTVVGAVALSAVAVTGAAIPLSLPWVPLIAPLAVLVSYVIVVARLTTGPSSG